MRKLKCFSKIICTILSVVMFAGTSLTALPSTVYAEHEFTPEEIELIGRIRDELKSEPKSVRSNVHSRRLYARLMEIYAKENKAIPYGVADLSKMMRKMRAQRGWEKRTSEKEKFRAMFPVNTAEKYIFNVIQEVLADVIATYCKTHRLAPYNWQLHLDWRDIAQLYNERELVSRSRHQKFWSDLKSHFYRNIKYYQNAVGHALSELMQEHQVEFFPQLPGTLAPGENRDDLASMPN